MGLIKAGMYIGAATYIVKKITEEKDKSKNKNNAPQNNNQYPPPGSWPQQQQDTRGYPPQYQQYPPPPQQQQPKFGYYDTHGPYEAQYQGAPPAQFGREERGTMEGRPYQYQEDSKRESFAKIEDSPSPRQWPEAQPAKSSKW
ncbi:uncharacterized protein LY89DRAFT_675321 [Mollisia scopiformis]|uniref:Uncharacterized protein n=1 Tax=Mollisia scopiformis TaxID=149040 RepID=A0A132BFK8_MOLSC|nr:uncharacterized protein LY89DRAFT_675321 [Mollisia scopiformis]KUJ10497.1 hypothetical protein LY89DRAFT_675321 [Mollisia scopiformis]